MSQDSVTEDPSHVKSLLDGFQRLYVSKDFSDLTITCNGHEWHVHRSWLCAQSKFFTAALGGNFKEAEESKINLDDDEPQVVEAFIHYLYNFDYKCESGELAPIVLDVKMYAIADKMFVESLKIVAAKKFAERAKTEWNTPAFATAVAETYECTTQKDKALRDIVIATVLQHKVELLRKPIEYASFHAVLRDTELGADVAMSLTSTVYKCPSCKNTFQAVVDERCEFTCPERCYRETALEWSERSL